MKLLVFVAVLSGHLAAAQSNWTPGVVVLNNSEVVSGEITSIGDLLLLKKENEVTAFPAHKVSSFRFYDSREDINRHYISLSDSEGAYSISHYYEVVSWGDVTVVRRNAHALHNTNPGAHDFDYFSLKNNQLVSLKKFRSRVYPALLEDLPFDLKAFVVQQNLSPSKIADAIRIVKFYNQHIHAGISIAGL